jgi:hypothetical protein
MSPDRVGDNDPLPASHRLAGMLGAIAVVTLDEGVPSTLVLTSAHAASIDTNKHVTAIKPLYCEPRLPLAGDFS